MKVKEKSDPITRRLAVKILQVGGFLQCRCCRDLQLHRISWWSMVGFLALQHTVPHQASLGGTVTSLGQYGVAAGGQGLSAPHC